MDSWEGARPSALLPLPLLLLLLLVLGRVLLLRPGGGGADDERIIAGPGRAALVVVVVGGGLGSVLEPAAVEKVVGAVVVAVAMSCDASISNRRKRRAFPPNIIAFLSLIFLSISSILLRLLLPSSLPSFHCSFSWLRALKAARALLFITTTCLRGGLVVIVVGGGGGLLATAR